MVTVNSTTIPANTSVFGNLLDIFEKPVIAGLVQLYYRDGNHLVQDAVTDTVGNWLVTAPTSTWAPGIYEVHYYAGGVEQQLKPYGAWETFEITGTQVGGGVGITYRGVWAPGISYHGNASLRDVVRVQPPTVPTVTYYSATNDHISAGSWALDSVNWRAFSNQFDSVATDMLLAQDAAIGRSITLGTDALGTGNFGILRSATASGILDGNGFFLTGTTDGTGLFRIGSVSNQILVSGLYWDGSTVTIAGTIFATAGKIGGTTITPTALYGGYIGTIPPGGLAGGVAFNNGGIEFYSSEAGITRLDGAVYNWVPPGWPGAITMTFNTATHLNNTIFSDNAYAYINFNNNDLVTPVATSFAYNGLESISAAGSFRIQASGIMALQWGSTSFVGIASPYGVATYDTNLYRTNTATLITDNPFSCLSVTTADPGSGAKPWKLGNYLASVVTLDTTHYVEVMIDGILRKLAIVT